MDNGYCNQKLVVLLYKYRSKRFSNTCVFNKEKYVEIVYSIREKGESNDKRTLIISVIHAIIK